MVAVGVVIVCWFIYKVIKEWLRGQMDDAWGEYYAKQAGRSTYCGSDGKIHNVSSKGNSIFKIVDKSK